ncbi:MAG: MBL fold metallo-hydrolase [Anaerolineales bacterium]|jgi:glyoxylase-like metal-dependent hydrolase (beta-lactamase superfamily II)
MLEIVPLMLGPVATNTYLIADSDTCEAAVIDPAWDGQLIAAEAKQRNWRISQIWITHAHFDHIGGTGDLVRGLQVEPVIALHPNDRLLWDSQGGAALFGFTLPVTPAPTLNLEHGMDLRLGRSFFKVLFTPGHTPGHCIFYCTDSGVCFCGDLIFQNSVGRTDLPGGDWETLVTSIRSQVFPLPDDTRLLSGHGPETTVGQEKSGNPFVRA